MAIVEIEDFHRFVVGAGLIADDTQRAEEEISLRGAEATLRMKLGARYIVPQDTSTLPAHTLEYLRRLVRAMALQELFEKRAVRLPEGVTMPFSAVDEEIEKIVEGAIVLDGVPVRVHQIELHNFPLLEDERNGGS